MEVFQSEDIVVVRISNVARFFIYESSMPKDMTCARMRKYIELRDKLWHFLGLCLFSEGDNLTFANL